MAYYYVLKCSDGSYYVGATKNFSVRLVSHNQGSVQFTKSRRPLEPIFLKRFETFREARLFEVKVKSWKKRKSVERMLDKPDNCIRKYCRVV